MSSINSEENKINIKKYTNKLKDLGYSSDNKMRGSFYSLNEASSVPLIKNKIIEMQKAEFKTPHAADLSIQDLDSHLTPHKTMKITIQQLNNLECKESQNFGEVGESIINRTSNKILNGRNFMNDNPFLIQEFSQLDLSSEYDEEQMNERSNSKPKPGKNRINSKRKYKFKLKVIRSSTVWYQLLC